MRRIHSFLAVLVLGLMSLGVHAQQRTEPPAVEQAQERPLQQERRARDRGPTLREVNRAARDGDIPRARALVDEILQRNPNNARAHFRKAQLAARVQDAATARAELQEAERLAPGLPFAREKAVTQLRNRLGRMEANARGEGPRAGRNARQRDPSESPAPTPAPAAPTSQTTPSAPAVETRPAGEDTRSLGSGAQAERKVPAETRSLFVGVLIGAAIVAVLAALFFRRRRTEPL